MGPVKIIDNFLEKDLIEYLYIHFQNIPHHWGHVSISNSANKFYATILNVDEPLYNFLCHKIIKLFSHKMHILRMYINIQHTNMEGDFHDDDGETTILLMITPTLLNNSGCFKIKINNEETKTINFIQNRLIIFPAKWKHKGDAPIEKNTPRITLAFKTKKYE